MNNNNRPRSALQCVPSIFIAPRLVSISLQRNIMNFTRTWQSNRHINISQSVFVLCLKIVQINFIQIRWLRIVMISCPANRETILRNVRPRNYHNRLDTCVCVVTLARFRVRSPKNRLWTGWNSVSIELCSVSHQRAPLPSLRTIHQRVHTNIPVPSSIDWVINTFFGFPQFESTTEPTPNYTTPNSRRTFRKCWSNADRIEFWAAFLQLLPSIIVWINHSALVRVTDYINLYIERPIRDRWICYYCCCCWETVESR